jgi:tetratricopeptide (TPR) repeat protein
LNSFFQCGDFRLAARRSTFLLGLWTSKPTRELLPHLAVWLNTALVLVVLLPGLACAQSSVPSSSAAIALEQQGKLAEAAQVWRAMTERNPRDAAAFASLGVVYSKEQKYPEAAAAYRKALALDPRLPGIPLNLGLAEFKQGHFASAIAPFNAALAAQPDNLQARALLGMSYYGA